MLKNSAVLTLLDPALSRIVEDCIMHHAFGAYLSQYLRHSGTLLAFRYHGHSLSYMLCALDDILVLTVASVSSTGHEKHFTAHQIEPATITSIDHPYNPTSYLPNLRQLPSSTSLHRVPQTARAFSLSARSLPHLARLPGIKRLRYGVLTRSWTLANAWGWRYSTG